MSVYGSALSVHVVFAILVVSGGIYTHLAMTLAPHARTADGERSHVLWDARLREGDRAIGGRRVENRCSLEQASEIGASWQGITTVSVCTAAGRTAAG